VEIVKKGCGKSFAPFPKGIKHTSYHDSYYNTKVILVLVIPLNLQTTPNIFRVDNDLLLVTATQSH
jgi:Aluminium induced protein